MGKCILRIDIDGLTLSFQLFLLYLLKLLKVNCYIGTEKLKIPKIKIILRFLLFKFNLFDNN